MILRERDSKDVNRASHKYGKPWNAYTWGLGAHGQPVQGPRPALPGSEAGTGKRARSGAPSQVLIIRRQSHAAQATRRLGPRLAEPAVGSLHGGGGGGM